MRKLLPIVLALGVLTTASAALPFVDNFGNGMLTNSDTIPAFWTLIPPPPGGNGDSALTLEGLRNNATSDSVMVNVDQPVVVPEPATNVLLICGLLTVGGLAIFLGQKLG